MIKVDDHQSRSSMTPLGHFDPCEIAFPRDLIRDHPSFRVYLESGLEAVGRSPNTRD